MEKYNYFAHLMKEFYTSDPVTVAFLCLFRRIIHSKCIFSSKNVHTS